MSNTDNSTESEDDKVPDENDSKPGSSTQDAATIKQLWKTIEILKKQLEEAKLASQNNPPNPPNPPNPLPNPNPQNPPIPPNLYPPNSNPPNPYPHPPYSPLPYPYPYPYPRPHRTGYSSGQEQHTERYNRNQRRIERWKLTFSGDPRSTSVEDFLFRLRQIAKREPVTELQLLRDVHLILEGDASDWFFTYVDDLATWEEFERKIRDRFGNPNQDQGICHKIHDRKQQRGETFAAFVTDIERLNKMLSKPLSRRRKFEIVWDNMRSYYRSRIATIEVRDLEHLIKLNRGIDAADASIHQQQNEARNQRQIHHIHYEEEEQSNDEPEEIDAIQSHSGPSRMRPQPEVTRNLPHAFQRPPRHGPSTAFQGPPRQGLSTTFQGPPRVEQSTGIQGSPRPTQGTVGQQQTEQGQRNLCWNCRRPGHNWRVCQESKSIFCYGCGELGRTIRSCHNCSTAQTAGNQRSNQGNQ